MNKKLIFIGLLVSSGVASYAEGRYEIVDSIPPKKATLPPIPNPRCPMAPARVFVYCDYGSSFLRLTLPAGVYYATIQLFNDSFEWTGLATTEQPLVELPDDLAGEYTIICRTDDGRVFSGTLEF